MCRRFAAVLFPVLYLLTAGTSAGGLVYDVIANHGMKGLKLTLYLTLLFIGCSRAFILFFDPYSSRGILGLLTTYITWSLGLPCVLAALGLLLLVFADATKMNLAPPRFQKLSTVMGAMVFNILIVITTDLIFLLTSKGYKVRGSSGCRNCRYLRPINNTNQQGNDNTFVTL